MKRALLIAGGTVGGLGAVLAITPPQLSSGDLNIAGVTSSTGTGTSASASSSSSMASGTTVATKAAKPVATKKATSGATTSVAAPVATATANQSAAATTAATTAAKSGTFTGPAVFVNYGTVQVQITVVNGKVTDAIAVQAPKGKNDRYTKMAVPILKQQTLAAQSANIVGASGASYTSYGWFTSLQGALADAGL